MSDLTVARFTIIALYGIIRILSLKNPSEIVLFVLDQIKLPRK